MAFREGFKGERLQLTVLTEPGNIEAKLASHPENVFFYDSVILFSRPKSSAGDTYLSIVL